ncbi:MAG: PEGA domain-containing protein [Lachnospiraceae bacterium]|nr:PEGA domain-containing protein [Lachnospiraceae bacterium]
MRKAIVPICVIIFIMFLGCYLIIMEYAKQNAAEKARKETEEEAGFITGLSEGSEEGILALLIDINEKDRIMDLQDISTGKIYELPYEEGIKITGQYGDAMTLPQVTPGQVFELYYSRSARKLTEIKVSDKIWTYTGVTRFSFDERRKAMTIGDEVYKFTKDLMLFSQGKKVGIMDITEMDTLIVRGIDKQILSVVVDKGHGYLRILNDAYFVGGWIEIGQDIIKPITEDMLIPVGEGSYTVKVTNRGYAGQEDVTIVRDKEFPIDLSKIEIEEVAIGHVMFKINPDYARLYIDDEITDFEERVPLEYGVHSVRVECAGYHTIGSNIKVGSEYAEIDITMDEESDDGSSASSSSSSGTRSSSSTSGTVSSDTVMQNVSNNGISTSSSSSSSSSSNVPVISGTQKIYIEQPSGAEVYLDGNYIGIAPVSTGKVTGAHVITLSRDGYKTKSYTVSIANDGNDVTFSFSALTKEE